ncbi:unnamed protein product [Amoebophrya sp. A120]|nr:unnamed protein product [Amoebophrya sp. A120]|eukprot:GSA120T00005588001.1
MEEPASSTDPTEEKVDVEDVDERHNHEHERQSNSPDGKKNTPLGTTTPSPLQVIESKSSRDNTKSPADEAASAEQARIQKQRAKYYFGRRGIQVDRQFLYPGYSEHLNTAEAYYQMYEQEVMQILRVFRLRHEAELFDHANPRDGISRRERHKLKDVLRARVRQLRNKFLDAFHDISEHLAGIDAAVSLHLSETATASESPTQTAKRRQDVQQSLVVDVRRKRAAAWYFVAYKNRLWAAGKKRNLLSFGWIGAEFLLQNWCANKTAVATLRTRQLTYIHAGIAGSLLDVWARGNLCQGWKNVLSGFISELHQKTSLRVQTVYSSLFGSFFSHNRDRVAPAELSRPAILLAVSPSTGLQGEDIRKQALAQLQRLDPTAHQEPLDNAAFRLPKINCGVTLAKSAVGLNNVGHVLARLLLNHPAGSHVPVLAQTIAVWATTLRLLSADEVWFLFLVLLFTAADHAGTEDAIGPALLTENDLTEHSNEIQAFAAKLEHHEKTIAAYERRSSPSSTNENGDAVGQSTP